jgi:F420-dependent oxidoreductase-like protein
MDGIGVVIGRSGGFGDTIPSLRSDYERARTAGVSSVWLTQHLGFDALSLIASFGTSEGPQFGTAVIPVQPRHPIGLAEQAVTAQALSGGRLALGLGLTHASVLDGVYGLPRRRSVDFLADYLSTLVDLMAGAKTTPNQSFAFSTRLVASNLPEPPPVLIAALGSRMLRLAGERTSGTITWMTGPRTVESHIAPIIRAAADAAGRPEPRVVVCLPVCITNDRAKARDRLRESLAGYRATPSYRAMLEREGVTDPVDVVITGDKDDFGLAFTGLLARGATDVIAIPSGQPEEIEATWAAISDLVGL